MPPAAVKAREPAPAAPFAAALAGAAVDLAVSPKELAGLAGLAQAKLPSLAVLGKSGALRSWLRIDTEGVPSALALDKHAVAARCGVPLRDLRVVEPGLTTRRAPPISCRRRIRHTVRRRGCDGGGRQGWPLKNGTTRAAHASTLQLLHRAAVARARHRHQLGARRALRPACISAGLLKRLPTTVKLLVTAEEALIPNADLPEVASFAATLSARLRRLAERGGNSAHADAHTASEGVVPFEFRVLEAALEGVCGVLEASVRELIFYFFPFFTSFRCASSRARRTPRWTRSP